MSRIGKKPIAVPAGVKVAVNGSTVNVEGPKGKLALPVSQFVKVTWTESERAIKVDLAPGYTRENREANANWGTARALLRNAIEGVTKGYEKNLQVVGTGWSATVAGKQLKLVLGFANAIMVDIPAGVTVAVDKPTGDTTPVKVTGIDRQVVGQFAASLRAQRKPEPYNGKGVKYTEEVIKRKQGKQFGA